MKKTVVGAAGKVSSSYYLRQSIILFMAFHLSLLSQSPYSTTTGLQNSSARCQLNCSDQPPTIPAYHLYPTRGFGLKRGVPHVNKKAQGPRDQHSMVLFLGPQWWFLAENVNFLKSDTFHVDCPVMIRSFLGICPSIHSIQSQLPSSGFGSCSGRWWWSSSHIEPPLVSFIPRQC